MKVTLLPAQLAASLLILMFSVAFFGGTSSALGVAAVLCILALPFVAALEATGLFKIIFRWLGWM